MCPTHKTVHLQFSLCLKAKQYPWRSVWEAAQSQLKVLRCCEYKAFDLDPWLVSFFAFYPGGGSFTNYSGYLDCDFCKIRNEPFYEKSKAGSGAATINQLIVDRAARYWKKTTLWHKFLPPNNLERGWGWFCAGCKNQSRPCNIHKSN